MQKLRDLYRQTQRNATADFDKVTNERMKKIHAYANKECDTILANQSDFTNLQEVIFYRDKFKKLVDLFSDSITQGYKKNKIQTEAKIILQENYVAGRPMGNDVQERIRDNALNPPSPIKKTGSNNSDIKITDSRNVINSFFDSKKNEIQQSKLGFKSIIQGLPQANKKFPVKAEAINSEDIRRMQLQIKNLKKQMDEKDFNKGLYQIKVLQYQERINQLGKEVQNLQRENKLIKQQSQKSENFNHHQLQEFAPVQESVEYGRYKIKYQNNDITKINNRVGPSQLKPQIQTLKSQVPALKSDQQFQKSRRLSQNIEIITQLNDLQDNPKDNSFRTEPRMLYDKEQMENELKNSVVRNKISFFRPSMVIYRGEDCDIAIKSLELVNFQKRKIIIYINNKRGECKANISYKYNQDYYQLAIQHKLYGIEAGKQGREQIEVILKNHQDMDSLIQAKLIVNLTEINFLVPALFFQFVEKRPILQKYDDYQKYTVKTIYQFSTIEAAEELIPFDKEYGYGEKLDTARAYAISRHHEGYVFLRWPKQGVIQLQTIKPWKLVLSFLLGKDY